MFRLDFVLIEIHPRTHPDRPIYHPVHHLLYLRQRSYARLWPGENRELLMALMEKLTPLLFENLLVALILAQREIEPVLPYMRPLKKALLYRYLL